MIFPLWNCKAIMKLKNFLGNIIVRIVFELEVFFLSVRMKRRSQMFPQVREFSWEK